MTINPPETAADARPTPTVVVMAKPAVPGRVKTRLATAGAPGGAGEGLDIHHAAEVHRALLECVLARASILTGDLNHRVLAVDGGVLNPPDALKVATGGAWRVIDQGRGDLGQRLDHVWGAIGGGSVIFLGVDSPDVPKKDLRQAMAALADHDAAIGPSNDGGYWTLAARRYSPALLRNIDWGGPSVYDQTIQAASHAGLSITSLSVWDDVDSPGDLARLQRRLADKAEPAFMQLRRRLNHGLSLYEAADDH